MKPFRDHSLRVKLLSTIVLTSIVAGVVLTGSLYLRELSVFTKDTEHELAGLSRVLGANCSSALVFDDESAAARILSSLEHRPGIRVAAVYTVDGTLFAEYKRVDSEALVVPGNPPATGGAKAANGDIQWVEPVQYNGDTMGSIYILGDRSLFFEQIKPRLYVMFLTLLPALILGVMFLGFFMHRVFQRPVLNLASTADEVTQLSDYSIRAEKMGDDELGHLVDQFNLMLDRVEGAHSELEQRGDDLARELSERSKAENELRSLTETLEERIQERTQKLEAQTLLQTRLSAISDHMRGSDSVEGLGNQILQYLADTFGRPFGLMYFVDHQQQSHAVASYAANEVLEGRVFAAGEGLVGQVAESKKAIELKQVPPEYMKIKSGLGEARPAHVFIYPIRFESAVIGVLELGSFDGLDEDVKTFVAHAEDAIGINLNTVHAQDQKAALLDETRKQAQALQQQQEELQATNEELEQQTIALQESREKLQSNQEELRATNHALQDQALIVEERQKQLEQQNREINTSRQELETKADELSAANRYKSEFLANMSHELRTPLNSMLILSQMLRENRADHLDEKEVEYAKTIHHAGSDLLILINDILDLSKVEAGRLEPSWSEVDISYLVDRFEKHFAHLAKEKGVTFEVVSTLKADFILVSDQQRLEQILRNLLANAIKFTSAGKVSLHIGPAAEGQEFQRLKSGSTANVAFRVEDTGIGIPANKQESIFHSFIQADGTTSRKYGGTGLGLSISREFTRLLGGEMHLASEEGKGSCFTLYLPPKPVLGHAVDARSLPRQQTVRIQPKSEPPFLDVTPAGDEAPAKDEPQEVGPPSLLIVEDDRHFAEVLETLGRDRGFEPIMAHDGRTGLNLAVRHQPQAIFLDIHLPEMDGLSLIEHLGSHPETRHIPIHAMSVDDYETDVLRLGAIGFLSKPSARHAVEDAFRRIEQVTSNPVANLLVVDDDEIQRNAIIELINADSAEVEVSLATNEEETIEQLSKRNFDCMILDLKLNERMSGLKILERISKDESCSYPPVIVYTGMDVTPEEEAELDRLADSIIIKGVASEERLLNEATLFLHRMTSHLPEKQRKTLHAIQARKHGQDIDKTILVVDDDSRNVFAVTHILERNGMEVLQARNGVECLKLLSEHPGVDLVLMDIMMPEMDGYQAMQAIRKLPEFKDLPIIALTAKAMREDRRRCLDAGANDYMTKPIDVDRLLSLLNVWMY